VTACARCAYVEVYGDSDNRNMTAVMESRREQRCARGV
jgi:hypothetical protein